MKILDGKAEAGDPSCAGSVPGTIVEIRKDMGFVIKCGDGCLLVRRVQLEGKTEMPAWAFWQGSRLKAGDIFD